VTKARNPNRRRRSDPSYQKCYRLVGGVSFENERRRSVARRPRNRAELGWGGKLPAVTHLFRGRVRGESRRASDDGGEASPKWREAVGNEVIWI